MQKAPGRSHRIGMAVMELLCRFTDDATAWFLNNIRDMDTLDRMAFLPRVTGIIRYGLRPGIRMICLKTGVYPVMPTGFLYHGA